MDGEEPGGEDVEEVVEAVGVGDAVDGGVQCGEEGEDVGDEAGSVEKKNQVLARWRGRIG